MVNGMKTLGIIGGMGPMATAYFYRRIIEMTDATCDQEHITAYISSNPCIPPRTDFILQKEGAKDPRPIIIDEGRKLAASGAQVIAVPCITSHTFYDEISSALTVPIINAVTETAKYLKLRGIERVGIMAADGTIVGGYIQKCLNEYGIDTIVPDPEGQAYVMHIIFDEVKAGKHVSMDMFNAVGEYLFKEGARAVLLGCTELSIVKRDNRLGSGFLDILDVLAAESVRACANLKPEFFELITR